MSLRTRSIHTGSRGNTKMHYVVIVPQIGEK